MNWEVTGRNSESIPAMQKSLAEYKLLRPYYYGDYYPLTDTGNITADNIWLAYQMNRPSASDGIILAFRRKDCKDESLTIKLRGIDSNGKYQLLNEDTQSNETLSGEVLRNGYMLKLNDKPGSVLIFYKKVP